METKELLKQGREIWDPEKLTLGQIIPRMGKVFGDICRWERNAPKDKTTHTDEELKKEIGNMIFSSIRWADDLGYDRKNALYWRLRAKKSLKNNFTSIFLYVFTQL